MRNLSLCAECDEAPVLSDLSGGDAAGGEATGGGGDATGGGGEACVAGEAGKAGKAGEPGDGGSEVRVDGERSVLVHRRGDGGGDAAASVAASIDGGIGGIGGNGVVIERHTVQEKWFQNVFIFAKRPWTALPPRSSVTQPPSEGGGKGSRAPNTTNSSGVSEQRRLQLLEQFGEDVRKEKRDRRRANKTTDQVARAEELRAAREANQFRVTMEPLSKTEVRLRFWKEVHEGTLLPFGRQV